jgi:REP element-mobilizing transposase RayT
MIGSWEEDRAWLFRDDKDRERFLGQLSERVEQFHIRLYLFVLMANHFHLVFETPQANCSKFMQALSTAYTVYFNLRHRRHGHLLDGRFKAKLIDGDDPTSPRLRRASYLLALSRYVHLNPVFVGVLKDRPIEERIAALRAYRWSSYPSYIGASKGFEFVTYGPILAEMHGKQREWPRRYREFVETGLAETDREFVAALKASPRSIGGEGFRAWVDELHQERAEHHSRPEDVSFRHVGVRLTPEDVLATLGEVLGVPVEEFKRRRHGSPLRAVAARLLIRHADMSQRQVADMLGMGSGAAVCNQLARLPGKLVAARRLRPKLEQAELRCTQRLEQVRQANCTGMDACAAWRRCDAGGIGSRCVRDVLRSAAPLSRAQGGGAGQAD